VGNRLADSPSTTIVVSTTQLANTFHDRTGGHDESRGRLEHWPDGPRSLPPGAMLRACGRRHLPDVAHIELVDDGNDVAFVDQPDIVQTLPNCF
jgi:hypothetical protein